MKTRSTIFILVSCLLFGQRPLYHKQWLHDSEVAFSFCSGFTPQGQLIANQKAAVSGNIKVETIIAPVKNDDDGDHFVFD